MPKKSATSLRVVTANRLGDGRVVYLTADSDWDERIEAARATDSDELARDLLRVAELAAEQRAVVEPYLIAVERQDGNGSIQALGQRERIRAAGPSVRLDLDRRAAFGVGRE